MSDDLIDLLPCPMCGASEGYGLSHGSTFRWWQVSCKGCGRDIGETRADSEHRYTDPLPVRSANADADWNEAASYAADRIATLTAERDALAQEVEGLRRDADRYRKWRAEYASGNPVIPLSEALSCSLIDAAIDAAQGKG